MWHHTRYGNGCERGLPLPKVSFYGILLFSIYVVFAVDCISIGPHYLSINHAVVLCDAEWTRIYGKLRTEGYGVPGFNRFFLLLLGSYDDSVSCVVIGVRQDVFRSECLFYFVRRLGIPTSAVAGRIMHLREAICLGCPYRC